MILRSFCMTIALTLGISAAQAQVTWEEVPGVGWRVLSVPKEWNASPPSERTLTVRPTSNEPDQRPLQSSEAALRSGCTSYRVRSEATGEVRTVHICH